MEPNSGPCSRETFGSKGVFQFVRPPGLHSRSCFYGLRVFCVAPSANAQVREIAASRRMRSRFLARCLLKFRYSPLRANSAIQNSIALLQKPRPRWRQIDDGG